MKTLKLMAIFALVGYGSSVLAVDLQEVQKSDSYKKLKNWLYKSGNPKPKANLNQQKVDEAIACIVADTSGADKRAYLVLWVQPAIEADTKEKKDKVKENLDRHGKGSSMSSCRPAVEAILE